MKLDCRDIDQWMILIGFFRYSLGRRSMMPGLAIQVLTDSWDTLSYRKKEIIKTEIQEAIDKGWAGSEKTDVPGWKKILELPMEEEE